MKPLDVDTLSAAVRAGNLALSIGDGLVLKPEQEAAEAATLMAARQYDSAPVYADEEPVGIYTPTRAGRDGRASTVGELMRPLSSRIILSSETRLSGLIQRLQVEPFLFIVDEDGITGFVTPADLGTVHVRTHFYLRLAHLEGMLGEYLRTVFEDQSDAIGLLSESRREQQVAIAEDLRAKDKFVDEIACLSLDDLVKIAGKHPRYRSAVRESGVGWHGTIKGLADFRNDIMHATRPFQVSDASHPGKLADRERGIDALIHATNVMVRARTASTAVSGA